MRSSATRGTLNKTHPGSNTAAAFCFFCTYHCAIGFQVRQIEQSADDKCCTGKKTAWFVFAWVVKTLTVIYIYIFEHSHPFRAPPPAQISLTSAFSRHLSTSLLLLQQPANQQPTPQPIRRNYQTAVSKLCITPSAELQWRRWHVTCFMEHC